MIKKEIFFVDFFDTLVIRRVSTLDVFKMQGCKFLFWRYISEFILRKKLEKDIKIQDIYRNTKYQIEKEIESEKKHLEINLNLINFLETKKKLGAIIYVVSDTYYGSDQIRDLLAASSTFQPHKIFTSSDLNLSKKRGLYKYILETEKLDKNNITIIGDDIFADGYEAMKIGVKYKLVDEVWDANLGKLISASKEIADKISPVIYNFCNWLIQMIQSNNYDQVWFLGRDSHIFYNYIKKNFDHCKYVPASRTLGYGLLGSEISHDKLKYLGIGDITEIKFNEKEKHEIVNYYKTTINNSKKIAIIDLGWNGSFQDALKFRFNDVEFHGLYFGVLPQSQNLNSNKYGYFFGNNNNSPDILAKFKSSIDLLEILLSELIGSALTIRDNEIYRTETADFDELLFSVIDKIQQNILKNIQSWNKQNVHMQESEGIKRFFDFFDQPSSWLFLKLRIVKYKVSPLNNRFQSLYIFNKESYLNSDRIWWKQGQKSYIKFLIKHNPIFALYLIILIIRKLVKFYYRVSLNIIVNSEFRKRFYFYLKSKILRSH